MNAPGAPADRQSLAHETLRPYSVGHPGADVVPAGQPLVAQAPPAGSCVTWMDVTTSSIPHSNALSIAFWPPPVPPSGCVLHPRRHGDRVPVWRRRSILAHGQRAAVDADRVEAAARVAGQADDDLAVGAGVGEGAAQHLAQAAVDRAGRRRRTRRQRALIERAAVVDHAVAIVVDGRCTAPAGRRRRRRHRRAAVDPRRPGRRWRRADRWPHRAGARSGAGAVGRHRRPARRAASPRRRRAVREPCRSQRRARPRKQARTQVALRRRFIGGILRDVDGIDQPGATPSAHVTGRKRSGSREPTVRWNARARRSGRKAATLERVGERHARRLARRDTSREMAADPQRVHAPAGHATSAGVSPRHPVPT